MKKDKNGLLIAKGDVVLVPQPDEVDSYSNEFMGTVVSIDGDFVTVEDNQGDCFSIEAERLEVVDGY